jgi:hypothetical protein
MRFAVVAHEASGTIALLAGQHLEGVESTLLSPAQAIAQLGRGTSPSHRSTCSRR